jgi:hypothetical protein
MNSNYAKALDLSMDEEEEFKFNSANKIEK